MRLPPVDPGANPARWWVVASIGSLMAVAVVVRLIGIGLEPLTFHGSRQLYDALMARGFWLDLGGQVPAGTEGAVRAATSAVIAPPVGRRRY